MLTQAQIIRIAHAVGARAVRGARASSGESVVQIVVPSHAVKMRLLAALATASGEDYDVIRLARAIVRAAQARTDTARAVAIHAWVQERVHHHPEPIETFPDALEVAGSGAGDCDDAALLVMALGIAVGLRMGVVDYHDHTCAAVKLGGEWWPLETTIAAEPGEDPYDAAWRLSSQRPDLGVS